MSREKQYRNFIRRNNKHRVPSVKDIRYRKLHLVYNEPYDIFTCFMIVSINSKLLSIVGDLDPNKYLNGIKIITPKIQIKHDTNCHELFIAKKDSPVMYDLIINWINSTGDKLDSNEYDTYKHGSLDLFDTGVFVPDKVLTNYVQTLEFYGGN